eukprot:gene14555-30987_t
MSDKAMGSPVDVVRGLLQLDAKVFAHGFFNFPCAFEIRLNHKGIAGADVDRRSAIRSDGDFALHDVDEFVGRVSGVVAAWRGFPGAGNHAAVVRGVLHPGLHGGSAI